jgi:magnesium chelatase family protein
VLFLDELPEFRRATLEVLRQPLEDGHVTVSRHRGAVRIPARFQLVGAMNPCPCGRRGTPAGCRCTPAQLRLYLARLSAPLLDRIDLHVSLPPVAFDEMRAAAGESTAAVRERVLAARSRQADRRRKTGAAENARLNPAGLRQVGRICAAAERLLRRAVDNAGLTARGLERLLRVARTVADLAGRDEIAAEDVAEALQFRHCPADTTESAHIQKVGGHS